MMEALSHTAGVTLPAHWTTKSATLQLLLTDTNITQEWWRQRQYRRCIVVAWMYVNVLKSKFNLEFF